MFLKINNNYKNVKFGLRVVHPFKDGFIMLKKNTKKIGVSIHVG